VSRGGEAWEEGGRKGVSSTRWNPGEKRQVYGRLSASTASCRQLQTPGMPSGPRGGGGTGRSSRLTESWTGTPGAARRWPLLRVFCGTNTVVSVFSRTSRTRTSSTDATSSHRSFPRGPKPFPTTMIASTSAVRVAPARAMAPRARVVSARPLPRHPPSCGSLRHRERQNASLGLLAGKTRCSSVPTQLFFDFSCDGCRRKRRSAPRAPASRPPNVLAQPPVLISSPTALVRHPVRRGLGECVAREKRISVGPRCRRVSPRRLAGGAPNNPRRGPPQAPRVRRALPPRWML